jgi:sugar-specific transcriptional regulator TrmB
MDALILKLKQSFGLDDRHADILDALNKAENLDAKQICRQTGIALGRIYDYLNFLLENKLIIRSSRRPYTYSIGNIQESIIDYTKGKIDNMLESQYDLIEMMGKSVPEHFDRITSSRKFTQIHISMITEAKKVIKYICLHTAFPYVLYPMDKNMFIKMRKAVVESRPTITSFDPMVTVLVYKTYLEAFESGKEFLVILEKKSFESHIDVIRKLGENFFRYWKSKVLEQLKRYNIKAYLIDEYLPFQIDINEKRVNVSFRHFEIINGVVIYGKDIIDLYNQVFEQHLQRAKEVLPIIKKLKF